MADLLGVLDGIGEAVSARDAERDETRQEAPEVVRGRRVLLEGVDRRLRVLRKQVPDGIVAPDLQDGVEVGLVELARAVSDRGRPSVMRLVLGDQRAEGLVYARLGVTLGRLRGADGLPERLDGSFRLGEVVRPATRADPAPRPGPVGTALRVQGLALAAARPELRGRRTEPQVKPGPCARRAPMPLVVVEDASVWLRARLHVARQLNHPVPASGPHGTAPPCC